MSFKLSKSEAEERDAIVARLGEARDKVQEAVDAFNAALEQIKAPLEAAVEAYNNVVAEAQEFAEGIASQADDDMSDKSERWLESERGQAAEEFKSEWENLSFDELQIDLPEEVSFDDPDHVGTLDGAPAELSA